MNAGIGSACLILDPHELLVTAVSHFFDLWIRVPRVPRSLREPTHGYQPRARSGLYYWGV